MMQTPTKNKTSAIPASTAALLLMAAGTVAMAFFFGYQPLWQLALIILMPALIRMTTVRIWYDGSEDEPAEQPPEKASGKLAAAADHFFIWLQNNYSTILAVLVIAIIAEGNVLFWTFSYQWAEKSLTYLAPILLAVMFVLCVILEKWCCYTESEDPYTIAVIRTLRSNLQLAQIALVLGAVALMLKLLGLYDATPVLKILLTILFLYETVFLTISLLVRLVRKEMQSAPEFVVPLPGFRNTDMHILTYLEENTGITMRSLWSMRLIKHILPGAAIAVALLLWLSSGLVFVDSWQTGVVFRFGHLQEEPLQPGLHLLLPQPFDRAEVYDTETIERITIGYVPSGDQDNIWTQAHGNEEYRLLLGSGDELVSINLRLEYKIDDVIAYVSNAAAPEAILQAETYQIITQRTICTDLETILAADREAFSESLRNALSENLARHNTGLKVVGVVLESIHPPVEVATVYQKIVSAGIEAEQIIIEAQNKANTTILAAQNQFSTTLGTAQVAAAESIASAKSQVAGFMASASADASFRNEYRFYKYLDALTRAYSGAKLVIVGDGIDSSNIYIGNLGQSSSSNEQSPSQPTEPTVPEETIPGMDVD